MSPSCSDCGGSVRLERVSVHVRSGGDYQILGPCCAFKHAAYQQYQPENPARAVERVQGNAVATDGGERQ